MCEWEAVIFGCGHVHRRKVKYCHEARNRTPYHECYQTGNSFWEEESINKSGREWEIPEENCGSCIDGGMRRLRNREEEPEPVMDDPTACYADGELEAVSALNSLGRLGTSGKHTRFTPLPSQKLVEKQHFRASMQAKCQLSKRKGSVRRYERSKRASPSPPKENLNLASSTKHRPIHEAMDLDHLD